MQMTKYIVEIEVPADMDSSDLLERLQSLAGECYDEHAEDDEDDDTAGKSRATVEAEVSVQLAPEISPLPPGGYPSKR